MSRVCQFNKMIKHTAFGVSLVSTNLSSTTGNCVTLGKLWNSIMPQFPHLYKWGWKQCIVHRVVLKRQLTNTQYMLRKCSSYCDHPSGVFPCQLFCIQMAFHKIYTFMGKMSTIYLIHCSDNSVNSSPRIGDPGVEKKWVEARVWVSLCMGSATQKGVWCRGEPGGRAHMHLWISCAYCSEIFNKLFNLSNSQSTLTKNF